MRILPSASSASARRRLRPHPSFQPNQSLLFRPSTGASNLRSASTCVQIHVHKYTHTSNVGRSSAVELAALKRRQESETLMALLRAHRSREDANDPLLHLSKTIHKLKIDIGIVASVMYFLDFLEFFLLLIGRCKRMTVESALEIFFE